MNKKILYSIIGLVLVGGLFSAVYAGPIITMITFAGDTHTTGNADVDGDLNVDGTISGATIDDLQSQINSASISCQNQQAIKAQIPAFELSPECVGEDNDMDGFTSDVDCDDNDPLINPGAEDLPDDLFEDSNCDGIDGDESNAIFVSTLGDDSNPGTKAQPKLTINSGIAAALTMVKTHVYVSNGIHTSQVNLANGISMWGKFDPQNSWARSGGLVSTISNSNHENGNLFAVKGIGILTTTTFADFTVQTPSTGLSGASTYGLYCNNCDGLTLSSNSISAGIAGNGDAGIPIVIGATGNTGSNGNPGSCDAAAGSGGPGGASTIGSAGGFGGNGGPEGDNDGLSGNPGLGPNGGPGGIGGQGDTQGMIGTNGQNGGDGGISGFDGAGGVGGNVIDDLWIGDNGDDGGDGVKGSGGGGGGGGGGQGGFFVIDGGGNGAGGGGAGGDGGTRGTGGTAGGGSFGLFLVDSTGIQLIGNTIGSDDGGNGGDGISGGIGGPGGPGGNGGNTCTDEVGEGGDGGAGGSGSNGGHGAGGAGGPSYSVFSHNTVVSTTGNILTSGIGGQGGLSPGNDGSNGASGTVN